MNQLCKVCGEPAAGFHFGAFTCEGCKSFFGRSYNNLSSITDCKNNSKCIIDKKNRTTCKACRLRKCYLVGMSKSGSRYGRRSNWFKIHCLLNEKQQVHQQEQQQQQQNKQKQGQSPVDNNVVMGITYPGINPYAASFGTPPQQGHAYNPAELMAAAIPFFRLMHSTEKLGHVHFPMPPSQLLLCPDAVVAYHHRNSVDSTVSSESPPRFSSYLSRPIGCISTTPRTTTTTPTETVSQTPELCVYSSTDEDDEEQLSVASSSPLVISNAENTLKVKTRVSQLSSTPSSSPVPQLSPSPSSSLTYTSQSATVISPKSKTDRTLVSNLEARLAFSQKMQSLSPVSVCSISAEYQSHTSTTPLFGSTSCASGNEQILDYQDAPLDLSTNNKTNQSNHTRITSPVIEPMEEKTFHEQRDVDEKNIQRQQQQTQQQQQQQQQDEERELRNKIFLPSYEEKFSLRLNFPNELEVGDEQESIFPQIGDNKHNFAGFTSLNNTSLRGIFVCV